MTKLEQLQRENERLREALEGIAALSEATQVKGGFFDVGTPDHLVDEDGFVPIHPAMKSGLTHAAKMAKRALEGD